MGFDQDITFTDRKYEIRMYIEQTFPDSQHLKVHKREKFFGSDVEFFTIL